MSGPEGGHMIGELSILSEWIPEQMEPGTIFVLENAGRGRGERRSVLGGALVSNLRTTGTGHAQTDRRTAARHLRIGTAARRNSSFVTNRSCRASRTRRPIHVRCQLLAAILDEGIAFGYAFLYSAGYIPLPGSRILRPNTPAWARFLRVRIRTIICDRPLKEHLRLHC